MISLCTTALKCTRASLKLSRRQRFASGINNRPILHGINVLDLSSVLAGPSVAQFLAELGATVYKIENKSTRGDVTRTWKLPSETTDNKDDRTAYFYCCNSGKQSVAVNVTKQSGLEIIHKLAEHCNVVIASYKPGDAEKLKLDYKTLSAINPSIIYASLSGYGQDDARPGYDAVIQAEAGFQYINGDPQSLPCKMPVAMMDILAAHQLKQAILVSLLQREQTGEGSFVDVSLIQAAVSGLANQATGYLIANSVPERMGSSHPSICPYGTVFQTGDGRYIVFGVGTDIQFARLCEILKCQEMVHDTRFQTNAARVVHRKECVARLQQRVVEFQNRDQLVERLVASNVPVAGVNAMDEVFDIPQARDVVLMDPNDTNQASGLRQVVFHSSNQGTLPNLSVPPHYGEHTESVLTQVLGMSKNEVDDLVSDGVVDAYKPT